MATAFTKNTIHEDICCSKGWTKKIKGNVVNVVSDTQSTYTKLPKMSDEQDTIAVKLKRNLRYDSSYIQESKA